MLQESFRLILNEKKSRNFEKHAFHIRLLWKPQVTWTVTCYINLLPDNF